LIRSSVTSNRGVLSTVSVCPLFGSNTPKQYARLARIEKVIAARKSGLGWADVAYACGFTDQAHLIHDFGTIVGGTPADFFGAARRWNFRGGDAVPSLADSYNPFIV
jgi:AraC-like DNA-binding protein